MADAWSQFWTEFDALASGIAKSKAVNVNSAKLRDAARSIVQRYFRELRSELGALGLPDDTLGPLDNQFQSLLRLANGKNACRSYAKVVRELKRMRPAIETEREMAIGKVAASQSGNQFGRSQVEKAIISTLAQMIPSAALSYEQALLDLSQTHRRSFRGVAAELRECLREVLDHLAPDAEVMSASWFKLEKDRTRPTMRQQTQFILRNRGVGKTARRTPEASVNRIEESAALLTRSVYERSSLSTHVAGSKSEVEQLKLYMDSVLAELLQIHALKR